MRLHYLFWNTLLFLVLLIALKRDDTSTSSTSGASCVVNLGDALAECFSANANAVGRKEIETSQFSMRNDPEKLMGPPNDFITFGPQASMVILVPISYFISQGCPCNSHFLLNLCKTYFDDAINIASSEPRSRQFVSPPPSRAETPLPSFSPPQILASHSRNLVPEESPDPDVPPRQTPSASDLTFIVSSHLVGRQPRQRRLPRWDVAIEISGPSERGSTLPPGSTAAGQDNKELNAPRKRKGTAKPAAKPKAPAAAKPKGKVSDAAANAGSAKAKAPISRKNGSVAASASRSHSTSVMPGGSVGPDSSEKHDGGDQDVLAAAAAGDRLCCVCKTTYDEGRFMIACYKCDELYQTQCVDMPDLDVDLVDQFFCPPCIQKSMRKTRQMGAKLTVSVSTMILASVCPITPHFPLTCTNRRPVIYSFPHLPVSWLHPTDANSLHFASHLRRSRSSAVSVSANPQGFRSADQYVPASTFHIPCDNVLLSRRHALLSLRTVKVSITTPPSTVAAAATGGHDSTTLE
ncbi:hypothetical protein B0H14DRAFT_2585464 [Mycena olivaceomarginata]|nr:hypothetical protein B0H14DRAFT_2585464 [Mycena olivaceomarginata]